MFALLIVYGLILIGGGYMGYSKAKSSASLISGVVTGIISIGAAMLLSSNAGKALGLGLALAVIVLIIFLLRYQKTRQPMPAMPLIAISLVVAIASLVTLTHKP